MFKMYKLILLSLCLTSVISVEKINHDIINKNVERSIDLTSQLVKITTTITLENTGKDPINSFLIALEPETNGNVSFLSLKTSTKDELKVIPIKLVENRGNEGFYSGQLKQALAAGRTTIVILELILTNTVAPFPTNIQQKDKQLVRYFGSHYFYTPYRTSKQSTTITLNTRNIENYSKLKPFTQSDSTLIYGPYADIPSFSFDKLFVHYENNSPFLTVTRLERLIEISHWGNIAVEESVEILHTGAKLKGSFSRYDYQRDTSSSHHSIKSYRTVLPAAAHSIYYRDTNGNISTSVVRSRKDWIELELRPRFPLFGGWRSSYILGYSVPSYQYLYKKSASQYVLNMRLIDHVFDDMHVDELETLIVLPVGVSNVKVTAPYDVERLSDSLTYKYLDYLGRIIIKLRKTNLVEQHIQDVEIVYEWQSLSLFHEPILLSITLYILFILVIFYVRLDFSIHKNDFIHTKKD